MVADPPDRKAEPAELLDRGLGGRRPNHVLEDVSALRTLDGHVMELVGRRANPDIEPKLRRLLAHPFAAVVGAPDPAEIVVAEAEGGAVVDHAPGLVAHGGIDHLAGRQPAHVPGEHPLHQAFGIRPQHLEFPQRRQVHDDRPLAAGPVFVQRTAVGETVGQPEAVIFGEVSRVLGKPAVETGLPSEFGIGRRESCERPPLWKTRSRAGRPAHGCRSGSSRWLRRYRPGMRMRRRPDRSAPAAAHNRRAATRDCPRNA